MHFFKAKSNQGKSGQEKGRPLSEVHSDWYLHPSNARARTGMTKGPVLWRTWIKLTFISLGYCPHGPKCLYTHDAHKVAICKDFLQTGTCQAGDACDLSHNPSSNRVPACVHFLRGKCTNDNCRYAHVRVNPGAPVCRAFATLGYCEAGSSCSERHVHECPDYANKGICRKPQCVLPHVDRAGQLRKTAAATQATDEEHIVLPDFSSDEEYDKIDSDDVDSDDLDDDVLTPGVEGDNGHELSQQQDFIRF